MQTHDKKSLLTVGGLVAWAICIALLVILMPDSAFAQIDQVREGVGATGDAPAGVEVNSIIATVINIFSFVVGVIAVIMIIIGGLKYITSTGDSGKVDSAKNTILYAVIGLVIVAVAQVVVIYVIDAVESVPSEDEDDTTSLVEPIVTSFS